MRRIVLEPLMPSQGEAHGGKREGWSHRTQPQGCEGFGSQGYGCIHEEVALHEREERGEEGRHLETDGT